MNRDIVIAASLAIALLGPWPRGALGQAKPVHHADVPVAGKHAPGVELLDAIMLKYRRDIGCSAASLTIARGHQMLYSRSYGWLDRAGTQPIHPDTPMGVASCDKPWEEAAIRQLALHGKIDLNASVFRVLKIEPAGSVVDNRMYDITFNHLLEHKAGWQGEPLNRANQAYEAARRPGTPAPPWSEVLPVLLRYIMVQRLAWTPGEKSKYDNMGYHVLKLMIMRVSGRSLPEYYRSELCQPFGLSEVKWIRQGGVHRPGEPPRLWNGLHGEENDAMSLGISTPALCTFMRYYWLNGFPRDTRNQVWTMYGSWDNSTSMMQWRRDEINVAFVFNGRGGDVAHDSIRKELDSAIDLLIRQRRIPPPPRAPPNLLVNGGFEHGPAVGGYVSLDPGSTAIKGWKVTRGQIDYIGDNLRAAEGKRSLDLHGSPGFGGIEQAFATEKGKRYRVTFALAGTPGGNPPVKRIAVSAAGKSATFFFDSTGRNSDDMRWVEYAWHFEAIASRTVLEFRTLETTDPNLGPALDEVRVEAL
jgi:choice-of-anchor C domain-containing protein